MILLYVPAAVLFLFTLITLQTPFWPVFLVLFLVSLIPGAVVGGVAKAVIARALYKYATTGRIPHSMPVEAIKSFYSA